MVDISALSRVLKPISVGFDIVFSPFISCSSRRGNENIKNDNRLFCSWKGKNTGITEQWRSASKSIEGAPDNTGGRGGGSYWENEMRILKATG